jgi:prepilin-type N-terminal cleavage/methylation domain-containing protein
VRRLLKRRGGFSLLELIISISLASLVLLAVAGLSGQIVRFQMEGVRKGTVTGWALISFMSMAKEIENANVLVWPSNTTTTSDTIIVCNNWSRLAGAGAPGARLDTSQNYQIIYYCYNAADVRKPIWRYYQNTAIGTCPASVVGSVPACDGSGTYTEKSIVAWNVERLSGQQVFTRDNTIGGVRIRYVVGSQASSEVYKQPVFSPFDLGLAMQKQYNNTSD